MKRRTKGKGPKVDEPHEDLEWFSPFAARGIMEQQGLTVSQLARLANRNHQTVSNLLAGDHMKRAQPGLLRTIAVALGVAVADIQTPPEQLIERLLHPVRGFEREYSVRTAIEAKRLFDKCETASKRDVTYWRDWIHEGEDDLDQAVTLYVRTAFSLLLTIGYHRRQWLVPFYPDANQHMVSPRGDKTLNEPGNAWHPLRGQPVKDAAHADAIVHLVRSWEYVLQPWWDERIEGVGLDYETLRQRTVEAAQHGAPRIAWQPAPRIGDVWLPDYSNRASPPKRAIERRDPYKLLRLGRAGI